MSPSDIIQADATTMAALIRARQVSCREVMAACLAQIHDKNPRHNAVVSLLDDDLLLSYADELDAEVSHGMIRGPLHGLPMAIKDTADAVGFPTTRGCKVLASAHPQHDSPMVGRLKAAGCIVIGKTNVPEFALGSHTFNEVFGATRNAWDAAVSAGGSSGGAAVAVALGMLPIADGSDLMGSLRNPAGWNAVFGMRPTQGKILNGEPPGQAAQQLATSGPIARSVRDIGLLLGIQSGDVDPAPLDAKRIRIGWLGDLNGHLPTEPGILDACEHALRSWESLGAVVERVSLDVDLDALWRCWLVLRSAAVGPRIGQVLALPGARDVIKEEAIWEHRRAQSLTRHELTDAGRVRRQYGQSVGALLQRCDVLALPTSQVWPFPIDERWPRQVAGHEMDTYHRWMEVSIYASLAGLPAISVPAGFHPNGKWPNGIQLIAARGADATLLQVAAAYEAQVLQRKY